MFSFPYRPAIHQIREMPETRTLRRHFKNDNLFIYFHVETGNWSVGQWVQEGKQLEDVKVLGPSLAALTPETMKHIDWLLNGPEEKTGEKMCRQSYEREVQRREEEKESFEKDCYYAEKYAPLSVRELPFIRQRKKWF